MRLFVHLQLEDVGPGVVAGDVEVVLAARHLVEVQLGGEDRLLVETGAGEHHAEGVDDGGAAPHQDRVRFLGEVADRDLPALYNLASVYVGASRRAEHIGVEGFGISLVEASACALPVVAGDSGGVADAVRDGETGFLVRPEDPAAFADAICRLLQDADLAKRIGSGGRRAVETYYNWDRVVRDLRAIEAEVTS